MEKVLYSNKKNIHLFFFYLKCGKGKISIASKLNRLYNPIINKYVNYSFLKGKKNRSYFILIKKFEQLNKLVKINPYDILYKAVFYSSPNLGLKPVRRGRFVQRKPFILQNSTRKFLGLKLVLSFIKGKKKERDWIASFLRHLVETSDKRGSCIKKQKEFHSLVLRNKALIYSR